jgi:hypothetical protein
MRWKPGSELIGERFRRVIAKWAFHRLGAPEEKLLTDTGRKGLGTYSQPTDPIQNSTLGYVTLVA